MINGHKSMEDLSALQQAQKAIGHVLRQIRDKPEAGWYLGFGTETFALLTEASATLVGVDVETVRRDFAPRTAADPRAERVEATLQSKPDLTETEADLLNEVAAHLSNQASKVELISATTCDQCGYERLKSATELNDWASQLEHLATMKGPDA